MDLASLNLTTDQLLALKAQLDGLDTSGRSPMRPRQLHNLTLLPTKDDPRPTFFWSAEAPRNAADLSRTTLYPRLMWEASTGREITVTDAAAERSYTAQGFVTTRPDNAAEPDITEQIRQQLDSLSPEDRALVVAAAQKNRLAKIQEAMAGLTDDELAALAASLESGSPEPAKRGPGRPRKDAAVA